MQNDILVLNRALALSRVGGDEDLLREIAGLFLEDYPQLVDKIRAALESNDAHALERASHSLKGSVANFCADSAYQAALELERIGRANDMAHAREAYERLDASLKSLQPELLALAGSQ
jgi:HPt (histidine-containing phosphotransfer) domain-containing protein